MHLALCSNHTTALSHLLSLALYTGFILKNGLGDEAILYSLSKLELLHVCLDIYYLSQAGAYSSVAYWVRLNTKICPCPSAAAGLHIRSRVYRSYESTTVCIAVAMYIPTVNLIYAWFYIPVLHIKQTGCYLRLSANNSTDDKTNT